MKSPGVPSWNGGYESTLPAPSAPNAEKPYSIRFHFLAADAGEIGHAAWHGMQATQMSQPGGTGKLGCLRIVKAAQRTLSSVDPIGCRSAVASSRKASSAPRSSMLREMSPVSVGLRTIETGGAKLAQRQSPRALQRFNVDAKVHKPASKASISGGKSRPAPDPRSLQRRSSRGVSRSRKDLRIRLSRCLYPGSRQVERDRPSAAGALSGLILNVCRV